MMMSNSLNDYLAKIYSYDGKIGIYFKHIFKKFNLSHHFIQDALYDIYCFDCYKNSFYYLSNDRINNIEKFKKATQQFNLPTSAYTSLATDYIVYDINKSYIESITLNHADLEHLLENSVKIAFNLGGFLEILESGSTKHNIKNLSNNIQMLGGLKRAEKYHQKRIAIFEKWEESKFPSYASFAQNYANDFDLSVKTIERWLSQKYKRIQANDPLVLANDPLF